MQLSVLSRAVIVAVVGGALWAQPVAAQQYQKINLVSDDITINPAKFEDKNLINAWGISESATGPFWVSAADGGVSTLYNTAGKPQTLVVNIPDGAGGVGSPTGQVFSGGAGFLVAPNLPAAFIFATEQGTISGWNPQIDLTHAINKVDNSANGASYKGLALANNGTANFIYAANFAQGQIDVFDTSFSAITSPGGFVNPTLPADFSPFNIQKLGSELYVTYAQHVPGSKDEITGDGLGLVGVFDANGNLVRNLASSPDLNAPWGLAIAPTTGFGAFNGNVLVGNFGNGKILAYDRLSGALTGVLGNATTGDPLIIDGLWGLQTGNGGNGGLANAVYFAAGPQEETHGVFGALSTAAPEPAALPLLLCALPFAGVFALRRSRQ